MRNRAPLAAAAVVLSLAIPGSASAGVTITVDDDLFSPEVSPANAGDTVFWFAEGGSTADLHNVAQDKNLFFSGGESQSVNYNVTVSAGTFPYYCEVHGGPGGFGMSGKLKVTPALGQLKRGVEQVIPVEWGEGTDTGDQFDVRYKGPGTDGKYKNWLKNTDQGSGDFGLNNEPVRVKSGKVYSFKVRSERSDTDKGSGFSPPLQVPTP